MTNLKPFRCLSSDCQRTLDSNRILFFNPGEFGTPAKPRQVCCPFCKRPGNIYLLEVIHLIAQDQGLGVVYGCTQSGRADHRFMFLCDKGQRNFRQPLNSPLFPRAFSLEPRAATCYNCLVEYGVKFDSNLRSFEPLPDTLIST